ncbi:hypothetical protein ACFQZS_17925 [Mucilaginibacter calamicampi]|uniref:Uncharacterized protein n=2 Tax=Mucilaginibacter calamicampi TaxID=1302352 RepID=A0ABW2Z1T4_9SPHI
MLAVTVMAGCKSGGDEKTAESNDTSAATTARTVEVATSGVTVKKTLNNVDSTEASALIATYKKAMEGQGMVVENASYFFNRRMVEKILAYLEKEGGNADGIRFYLGKKSATDAETMLLPVTTKAGSAANKHTDYYDHDEALFDTARIVTLRVNKKGTDPGAVLYDKCPTCPDLENGCKLTPGSLPRSYAEKMIQKFDGKNMNTNAIWLPLSLFKNMAKEKSFNGIRVYFGTYPDKTYTPPGQPSYEGRNTIVLTYVDRNGMDDFNCDPLPLAKAKGVNALDGGGSAGPPQNNGGLCPILCD